MTWLVLGMLLGAGPAEWALPGLRVHVVASEALDADRLRGLARPEVVLWVRTRSNGLRRSTAETLQLAGSAFVEVRPPLGAPALAAFVGRVGPWIAEHGVDVARVRRWSPGQLAVDVEGPFTEELAARVRVMRPVAVRWSRGGSPERGEWLRARAFSGVELSGLGALPVDCETVPERTWVRVRVALASVPAEGICGLPLRVEVPAGVDAGDVHRLLLVHPDADLLVDVGEEIARADAARRWIEQLASATPRSAGVTPGASGGRDGGPL
ncbi:MAG: hypothetical protein ACXWLG_09595 [Myxococcaceae bacterium]